MTTMPSRLGATFSSELQKQLLDLWKDLHRFPELSFHEDRTAERLHGALEGLSPISLDRVAGTGVVARIRGSDSGAPMVAVRGDIDALPIQEETGLPYSSEMDGVMHACGHDVHATWAVGAAHLLTERPAEGDVLIILQPAEETGKGAPAIIDTGVLDDVRAIFGAHVDRRFQVGEVVADAGPLAAAADMFYIELHGSGGHGARPHEVKDPIVGAAAVITALQTIVSRKVNPGDAGVVTVGTINAGSAPNVIPATVTLSGTLRATDPQTRDMLHREVKFISEQTAAAYGLRADVRLERGTPPIVNDAEPVAWAREAVTSLLGAEALQPLGTTNMGGEDFAFYLEKTSGCFLRVGAREPDGEVIPAHTSKFYAGEGSIFVGASVLAETARLASAALAT